MNDIQRLVNNLFKKLVFFKNSWDIKIKIAFFSKNNIYQLKLLQDY